MPAKLSFIKYTAFRPTGQTDTGSIPTGISAMGVGANSHRPSGESHSGLVCGLSKLV